MTLLKSGGNRSGNKMGELIHDNNDFICTFADTIANRNKIKEHLCEVPTLKKPYLITSCT